MPQVIYRGRWPTKRTSFGEWIRGQPQDVTQEWLDTHAVRLVGDPDFVVIGNEAVDETPSGESPNDGWTRAQIYDWLTLHDVRARAGLTKPQLLAAARGVLGMDDEEESDDSAEESMSEPVVEADMAEVDNDQLEQEVID